MWKGIIRIKDKLVQTGQVGSPRHPWKDGRIFADARFTHDLAHKTGADDALANEQLAQLQFSLACSTAILAQVPVPQGERSIVRLPRITVLRAYRAPSAWRSAGLQNSTQSMRFVKGNFGCRTESWDLAASRMRMPKLIKASAFAGTISSPVR